MAYCNETIQNTDMVILNGNHFDNSVAAINAMNGNAEQRLSIVHYYMAVMR